MDPIADFFTRIRNGSAKLKDRVDVPISKIKMGLAKVLKDEGYIANYKSLWDDRKHGILRVFLKYSQTKDPAIRGLTRVSKPGLRIYASCSEIPPIRRGFGTTILSTTAGLLTDRQAREKHLGGEVVCQIW